MRQMCMNVLKVLLPVVLGVGILYWMYRDFDFRRVEHTLCHEMDWWIMAASLVFGITAQVFRGIRWKQTLAPLGEHPRTMNCIHAIFISYTTSLIIPRSGEVTRCGILTRYDGTNFPGALGTVVTERIIDSLVVVIMAIATLALQMDAFSRFFDQTGTNFAAWVSTLTSTGYIIAAVCTLVAAVALWYAMRRFTIFSRLRRVVTGIKDGIFSLRHIDRPWLFALYTIGIWGSYFLHFYLTFFCFPFTSSLGAGVAMLAFVVGSFAVIVPTPNGMGSWHFAVGTVLTLSGVTHAADAETFVLIVHAIQTALMPLLGIYSAISLLTIKHKPTTL